MSEPQDVISRYAANLRDERESAAMYSAFAGIEKDKRLAEVYSRMAEVETRHATVWADRIRQAGGQPVPEVLSWRSRALIWIAKRFGVGAVLPIVSAGERNASHNYDAQPEAKAAGMPADERSHERIFGYLLRTTKGGIVGSTLAQIEGRHRGTSGGNALRAAVLGSSDGLTSNLSLVMGVAGASLQAHQVLLTGLAGLLAGALSMAIGEWLSVQSARELYGRQIAIEQQELSDVPEEEREELSLIYQAKGLDPATADNMAARILSDPTTALDTLAREELGLDPAELGGSAWEAAIASFLLFAVGAAVPVIPFTFMFGWAATITSVALSVVGLFIIGTGITLTTGANLWKAAGRQVLLGVAAALITFGLGRLVGGLVG
ncbi:MAG TPA: VIT1/CCC1 transporter family protein [Ktedonobacterales bacterium]